MTLKKTLSRFLDIITIAHKGLGYIYVQVIICLKIYAASRDMLTIALKDLGRV